MERWGNQQKNENKYCKDSGVLNREKIDSSFSSYIQAAENWGKWRRMMIVAEATSTSTMSP